MKIKYLEWYHGIRPGTVVDEGNEKHVAAITKKVLVNPEKNLYRQVATPVPASTPTTADLEKAEARKLAKAEGSAVSVAGA